MQSIALDVSRGHIGDMVRPISEDLMEHVPARLDSYLAHHLAGHGGFLCSNLKP